MKLLTHNFLSSQFLKGVKTGYPLILRATKVQTEEVEYNDVFMKKMIPKLDYPALVQAAKSVTEDSNLPDELVSNWEDNEEFLKKVHSVIMGIDVVDGELECPESGHKFMIRSSIPNMLVDADKVE
uniref:Multifunctional methyltransferase subunit TRM112-like protein n=1 Tax=Ditylenchus dipsaci TaxID=166011 RepID=A0A915DXX7_9BILA